MSSTAARERAESAFQKKERQLAEGRVAMAEYEAGRAAEREKTARLRALRLAREADANGKPDASASRTPPLRTPPDGAPRAKPASARAKRAPAKRQAQPHQA
ncbi:MAG: hypothetical protein ACRECO_11335 [Xanthobacteraceae bacterium]